MKLWWALLFGALLSGQQTPRALLEAGRARDALTILLDEQRSAPPDADRSQLIGLAYTQLENFAEAEKYYREAGRLNPRFWAARKNLGTVLWFLDRKQESEREFQAVAAALPADPVPHLYLGLAAHARRDYAAARLHFKKAGALASENPEVLPVVVDSYMADGKNSDPALVAALEKLYGAYTRAIEAEPDSPEPYIALAGFASAHANNAFALEVIGRGLRRQPRSGELLFEQGLLLELTGDRSRAEAAFALANETKPEWNMPLLAMGVSKLESGENAQAAAVFRRAIAAGPGDARGYYLCATALSKMGEAHSAEAIAALRKAVALDPRDARSHALLGQLLLAAGEPDAAAREWQAALKTDPENGTALYQLGLLYRKQGKVEESRRLLATFQRVKAQKRADEESLVQILKVVPGKPLAPEGR